MNEWQDANALLDQVESKMQHPQDVPIVVSKWTCFPFYFEKNNDLVANNLGNNILSIFWDDHSDVMIASISC